MTGKGKNVETEYQPGLKDLLLHRVLSFSSVFLVSLPLVLSRAAWSPNEV